MKTIYIIAIFVLLSPTIIYGKEGNNKCRNDGNIVSPSYVEEAMKWASPSQEYERFALIEMSIIVNLNKKIILRTDGYTYSVFYCKELNNIYEIMNGLKKNCKLPYDPFIGAKSIGISWSKRDLNNDEFFVIHNKFIESLNKYTNNIQNRVTNLLKTKNTYTHQTANQYWILYDNNTHHIEIQGVDIKDEDSLSNPMILWAKDIVDHCYTN